MLKFLFASVLKSFGVHSQNSLKLRVLSTFFKKVVFMLLKVIQGYHTKEGNYCLGNTLDTCMPKGNGMWITYCKKIL